MTQSFFCQICEDLKKDPLAIGIYSQLRSQHQIQYFSSDHAKFKFQNGLLYFDGFLYVHNGLAWLQVLQARHNDLAIGHFRFNKTMELMFQDYWWP
jgi:hypothetical protein